MVNRRLGGDDLLNALANRLDLEMMLPSSLRASAAHQHRAPRHVTDRQADIRSILES
jgi:hypothetical protein